MTRDDIEELLNEFEVDRRATGIIGKVSLAKTLRAHGFTLLKMIEFFEDYLEAIDHAGALEIRIHDYESILRRNGLLRQRQTGDDFEQDDQIDALAIQLADYESMLKRKGILKQQNRGETK